MLLCFLQINKALLFDAQYAKGLDNTFSYMGCITSYTYQAKEDSEIS
jgi:hypothetical protein